MASQETLDLPFGGSSPPAPATSILHGKIEVSVNSVSKTTFRIDEVQKLIWGTYLFVTGTDR